MAQWLLTFINTYLVDFAIHLLIAAAILIIGFPVCLRLLPVKTFCFWNREAIVLPLS